MYFEVLKRFDGGRTIPLLDPVKDMQIESKTLNKLLDSRKTITRELESCKDFSAKEITMFDRKNELKDSIKLLTE